MPDKAEAELIEQVKQELKNIPKWVYWVVMALGIVGIIACLLYWYVKRKKGEE